jgi:hypothetical protein
MIIVKVHVSPVLYVDELNLKLVCESAQAELCKGSGASLRRVICVTIKSA